MDNHISIHTFWGAHGSGVTTAMVKYAYKDLAGFKQLFITDDKYNVCAGKKLETLAILNGQDFQHVRSIEEIKYRNLEHYDEIFIKLFFKQKLEDSSAFKKENFVAATNRIFIISALMITNNKLMDKWKASFANEMIITYMDVLPLLDKDFRIDVINKLIELSKSKKVWLSSGAEILGDITVVTERGLQEFLRSK